MVSKMADDEPSAAVLVGSEPPTPDLGLCVTRREYDEIETRLASLVKPDFDDVMRVIADVLGQNVADRMHGHVVGFEIVAELPDDRWFRTTDPVADPVVN